MTSSLAKQASDYGNRRHRPQPVKYGLTHYGALCFIYSDSSSLIVRGDGDLNRWLWNFRADNALRDDAAVAA